MTSGGPGHRLRSPRGRRAQEEGDRLRMNGGDQRHGRAAPSRVWKRLGPGGGAASALGAVSRPSADRLSLWPPLAHGGHAGVGAAVRRVWVQSPTSGQLELWVWVRACWGHGGTALAASLAQSSGHLRALLWCPSPASPSPAGVHSYSQTSPGPQPTVQACKPLPGSFPRVPPSASLHRRNVGPFSPAPCVRPPSNPGSSCPVHLLFDTNLCSAPRWPPHPALPTVEPSGSTS